jgi:hypothetical protein
MAEVAYASANKLVLQAFEGLLPPERIDVPTQWAERKRWLNNTGGGHVGRYSPRPRRPTRSRRPAA